MRILQPDAIADAQLVSSNVPETTPEWSAGSFDKGDRVRVAHDVYESLQDSNTDEPTAGTQADPATWALAGKTNRWKMFDYTRSTEVRTENPDSITVVLQPSGIITSLILLGLEARTVTIERKDAGGATVYSQTVQLFDPSGITDWWLWFHVYPDSETRLAILDLPGISGGELHVTISNTGATAACGKLAIGLDWDMGKTQPAPPTELIPVGGGRQRDYFGNLVFTQQRVYREISYSVLVQAGSYDRALQNLKRIMAGPAFFIGSQLDKSAIMFGAIKDTPTGSRPHASHYATIQFTAEEM